RGTALRALEDDRPEGVGAPVLPRERRAAFALLDEPPDVPELPNARPLVRAAGAVAFRHVRFAYDGEHPVLRDVTFEVEPGTRVAITGATGAGKTTLVSLLTRFYDPTAGAILLDGMDLREYRVADLRSQFAIVLQEPVLFSTSIAENIAYGRPGADQVAIVRAAQAAGETAASGPVGQACLASCGPGMDGVHRRVCGAGTDRGAAAGEKIGHLPPGRRRTEWRVDYRTALPSREGLRRADRLRGHPA